MAWGKETLCNGRLTVPPCTHFSVHLTAHRNQAWCKALHGLLHLRRFQLFSWQRHECGSTCRALSCPALAPQPCMLARHN